MADDLLTTTAVAAHLGVDRRYVARLIRQGRLPATKHGRDWLIRATDLEGLGRRPYRRRRAAPGPGAGHSASRTPTRASPTAEASSGVV